MSFPKNVKPFSARPMIQRRGDVLCMIELSILGCWVLRVAGRQEPVEE
jgi:hypothetical protein